MIDIITSNKAILKKKILEEIGLKTDLYTYTAVSFPKINIIFYATVCFYM